MPLRKCGGINILWFHSSQSEMEVSGQDFLFIYNLWVFPSLSVVIVGIRINSFFLLNLRKYKGLQKMLSK